MPTDDAAFRDFVEREYAPLVRALTLYCGDRPVAEEFAQDAFARAYSAGTRSRRWRAPAPGSARWPSSLPDRQREALIHRYFLGASVAETAESIGVSSNAVKSATFKGIENLRRHLGDEVTAIEEDAHHA